MFCFCLRLFPRLFCLFFFFNDTATTEIYTLSLHDALPICGYTYRFENVPAYVPPGHGMVYLTAVALARSGLFVRHPGKIAIFVVGVWGTWSLWGVSVYPDRGDWVGALLFSIFLVWLIIGRSPMVYLAAFFITKP